MSVSGVPSIFLCLLSLLAVAEVEEEVRDLRATENLYPKPGRVASLVIARSGAVVVC
jgi:hypothetical protein